MPALPSLLAAIATAYGMVGSCSSLLQARCMVHRRCADDVSLGFLCTVTCGYLIWLAYGISIKNLPLIAVDSVGLTCGAVTCSIALHLRRTVQQRSSNPPQRRSLAPADDVLRTPLSGSRP